MKRQKECFIGVSAVVHLFLKIAGAMPVSCRECSTRYGVGVRNTGKTGVF